MPDGRHSPDLALSANGFWASSPGDQEVHFLLRFTESQLQSIRIRWRFVPKSFVIEGFFNSLVWREILSRNDNTNNEETISRSLDFISGVRVVLRDTDARLNDKLVYGIEGFELRSQLLGLELGVCGTTDWQTEELDGDLADNQAALKSYRLAVSELDRKLGQMREMKPLVDQATLKARELTESWTRTRGRLEGLIESLSKLQRKTNNFLNANLLPEVPFFDFHHKNI